MTFFKIILDKVRIPIGLRSARICFMLGSHCFECGKELIALLSFSITKQSRRFWMKKFNTKEYIIVYGTSEFSPSEDQVTPFSHRDLIFAWWTIISLSEVGSHLVNKNVTWWTANSDGEFQDALRELKTSWWKVL